MVMSLRTRPVMGRAGEPTRGGWKCSEFAPGGTSHCQPSATMVTPRFMSNASP